MRNLTLILLALTMTACGVQRPLIRPKDIPAYEEEQRKKREKIEREMEEDQEKAAQDPAIIQGVEPQK